MFFPTHGSKRARRHCIAAAVCVVVLAAGAAPAGPTALQARIAALVRAYEREHGTIAGVSAVDLRTARPLVAIRDGEPRTPASNQKLLTSAFALERLGGNFKFTTVVYRWSGGLLVVGDGDPTLGDPVIAEAAGMSIYAELDAWAADVKKKLGKEIAGDLLVCGSADASVYRHRDWPTGQHHRWYAAPVAPLNFHDNCFDVTFRRVGKTIAAEVAPVSRLVRIKSAVRSGRKHLCSVQIRDGDSVVSLRGTVRPGSAVISAAVNDPPLLLGRVFTDRLARAGVTLGGRVRRIRRAEVDLAAATPLTGTTTALSLALARANKRSLNLAAECIFLRAGDGTWKGSANIETQVLIRHFGLAAKSFVVADGSGLSRHNRVAPAGVTAVLAAMLRHKNASIFLASLPASGVDGSMRSRLSGRRYRNRVLAKTGSIAGSSCLSGYVLGGDGKPAIAFSVLVNDVPAGYAWTAKQLQDSICRLLVETSSQ
ncbi:MAG: D-alanyl-D-alanine carboxypeptidase/D-alanyl-D-alanine-endopeptidase [Planctomycetota bacterium]|nr:D-alanyl-D-alanine carboxypeptidase/D-alanyl-D-alanine-endopeptidase [Planctomycetota bacterium]